MMNNGTVADFRAYAARQMNNLHHGNRGLYRFFIILLEFPPRRRLGQRHHRLKRAVGQELLLRGSRDFTSAEEYRQFLKDLFEAVECGAASTAGR